MAKKKMAQNQFYCVSCRKRKTASKNNICARKTKNNRHQLKSICPTCKNGIFKFVTMPQYKKYNKC